MKINQKTISIIGVLMILGLLLASGPLDFKRRSDYYENYSTLQQTPYTRINDELSEANRKLDSLKFKKNELVNEGNTFDGWSFGYLGIGKLRKKDMLFSDTTVYLKLENIAVDIKEEMGKSFLFYYEKNGQGFLSRTKWQENYEATTDVYDNNGKLINSVGNKVSFVDKKVDYKYLYANKSMLIPLKSGLIEICATIIVYAIAFLQFALIIFIIFLFFRFLVFIARNNAFEEENILRIKYISIALFILAVNSYFINGVIYLIFISQYSSDGIVITYSFWDSDYETMISAIVCYLLYTAFKHGMILQKEQELTI